MDKYLLSIITLIIFSIIFILYIRISTKISKIPESKAELNTKEGDNDSAEYDSVAKDPLSHLKSSNHSQNYPNPSDFTLLE